MRPMLTCRELIDFIAAYVEGGLASDERSDFETHLAVCPDCVNYLESYRETRRLETLAASDEAVPDSVPEELIRAVLRSRRP